MDWVGTVISSLATLAAGIFGTWFVFRGKRVDQEIADNQVEASAADAFLKGQQTFQAYVDSVVEKRVQVAVAPLQEELAELRASMVTVRRESHEMNDAFRSRETQLWLWNIRERPGPMPELPEVILRRLGISHLTADSNFEDTEPIRRKATE